MASEAYNIDSDRANLLIKLTEEYIKAVCSNKINELKFIRDTAHIYEHVGKIHYTKYFADLYNKCQDLNIIVKQYRVGKSNKHGVYVEFYYIKYYKDEEGKQVDFDSRANFIAERVCFDDENHIIKVLEYDTRKTADARRTAFLILDAQESIVRGFMSPSNEDDKKRFEKCVDCIEKALNHARYIKMPVVHVRHIVDDKMNANTRLVAFAKENGVLQINGSDTEIIPELAPLSNEKVFDKSTINVFAGTNISQFLRANDINTVVITGFVSHFAVLAGAIGAADEGFNVAVLNDGTVSGIESSYDATMKILRSVATIMSTGEFIENY